MDGPDALADLQFGLVEAEGGDVPTLGETTTLGGEVAATVPPVTPDPVAPQTRVALV